MEDSDDAMRPLHMVAALADHTSDPSMLERVRLLVTGRPPQSAEGIVHVIADRLDDCSAMMVRITEAQAVSPAVPLMRRSGHPRQERVIPPVAGLPLSGKPPDL